jgi:manganese/zinc/iron transport system substrate-binding protein
MKTKHILRNTRALAPAFALAIFALPSCRIEPQEQRGPLHIVTTTGIIEDCVKQIVGDSAEVSSIMGPGTDPHIYKPTPGDIELLEEADVIICNGLHLEGKMSELLDNYAKEKPVLKVSDGIDAKDLIKSTDMADSYDPHIWFDTKIWRQGLFYITQELAKIDSMSGNYYRANHDRYLAELTITDEWVESQLALIDSGKRVLVTSHDAFSYFGRRYHIEVKGIQGVSTLSEVGLKDISDMVDFLIAKQIKSIFVETSTSQKTAESIVDGCRAKKYDVLLEGPLYSDALGEPDSEGGTYVGMLRSNVAMIVKGLSDTTIVNGGFKAEIIDPQ